jgi:hypothetical protein
VASSEALDVLHGVIHPTSYRRIRMTIEIVVNLPDAPWAIRPTSYRRIRMTIEIVVNLPDFFFTLISLLATILS